MFVYLVLGDGPLGSYVHACYLNQQQAELKARALGPDYFVVGYQVADKEPLDV